MSRRPLAVWRETDSLTSLSPSHQSLYLYDRKSATNLAAICWDISSFHVFQRGHFLLLCTCASPLFCVLIVFGVNSCIVWLSTCVPLSEAFCSVSERLGDNGPKGLCRAYADNCGLQIHLSSVRGFFCQFLENILQIGSIFLFSGFDIALTLTSSWITNYFAEHRKQTQHNYIRHADKEHM